MVKYTHTHGIIQRLQGIEWYNNTKNKSKMSYFYITKYIINITIIHNVYKINK